MRHLLFPTLGAETFYVDIEYAETIGISLFGMAAHELHTDTYSQNRLPQIPNKTIETLLPKISHRRCSLAYTGKYDFIGSHKSLFIIGKYRSNSYPPQSAIYRIDITGIILNNRNLHDKT